MYIGTPFTVGLNPKLGVEEMVESRKNSTRAELLRVVHMYTGGIENADCGLLRAWPPTKTVIFWYKKVMAPPPEGYVGGHRV